MDPTRSAESKENMDTNKRKPGVAGSPDHPEPGAKKRAKVAGGVDVSAFKPVAGAAAGSRKAESKSSGGVVRCVGGRTSWVRPKLPNYVSARDTIAFQNIDIDYYTSSHNPRRSNEPVIRMYGATMNGNSVMAHISGFEPYFYVAAWDGFNPNGPDKDVFGQALNAALAAQGRVRNVSSFVKRVQVVERRSLWQYQFQRPRAFLQVFVAVPALVATARRLLGDGIRVGSNGFKRFASYEANFAYVLRFMTDKSITSGGWVELPAGKYRIRSAKKESRCQLEVDIDASALVAHAAEGQWAKIAPLRILSFDIECASRENRFPEAEHDPVIQIANVVQCLGQDAPFVKNVFTLKGCAPIAGAEVISSDREGSMLMKWRDFVEAVDPDIITGYNICNFDLPYLLNRAAALKQARFPYLGRVRATKSTMRESTFSSRAYGTRNNVDTLIEGVVQFDAIKIIRREHKLTSYTLNNVSAHFLGQQKEDVHYSIITDLQNGTDATRRRLAVYCLKDALLPIRLLNKLMLVINHVEMARVTGVPLSYLITRGQQIKVLSQLYRKARTKGFVIPVRGRDQNSDETFEGATVIQPKRGYYTEPIATLDFASLYPSIMMAHNLCYTTYINSKDVKSMNPDDYVRTPLGHCFVKEHVQKGLLPEVLHELLSARKAAKKAMKAEKDPFRKAVLNGRQLALKISCNSVYGFTGATVGQLPCLQISSGVTAFGRQMIDQTKSLVEEWYSTKNGFAHDSEVVYGDTDSVMIKFGVKTVKEAMDLGEEAAKRVTETFEKPIKLEFEKVYYPYLLMNKKRYAGLYWTRAETWDKMDAKGIETVRRDNCALVRTVVSECLHRLLVEKDSKSAIDYVKKTISDLLCNRVDLSMLVITKSLTKLDGPGKQAHVELAKKMMVRDAASAPKLGDRVAYVITRGCKGAKNFEKAEDPIWVLDNNIPVDYSYYLDNQLKLPLTRIFEPVIGNVSKLFQGDHTRKIRVGRSSSAGGLMRFAVKKETCANCNVPLPRGRKTLCKHCEPMLPLIYGKKLVSVRKKEELHNRLWTECQRCSGSLHQDVLCSNRDCPIFYRRKKVQKDLDEATTMLQRFAF